MRCSSVLAALGLPVCLAAQTRAPRVWYTTAAEISATPDGWVEMRMRRPVPIPPHVELPGASALFAPDSVRRWLRDVHRAIADTARSGRTRIPSLTDGVGEISASIGHDTGTYRDALYTNTCFTGGNAGPTRAELLLLVDALTKAANAASSARPVPAPRGVGPFSAAEVTCIARARHAVMPAWSPSFGPRPADRSESLVRFVIAPSGRIELPTLRWEGVLPPSVEQAARASLAEWRFDPPMVGGRGVRQSAHAVIWFADSSDAAEWQLAGRARTHSFVARSDGRVEHGHFNRWNDSLLRADESVRRREAYDPSAVRGWISGEAKDDNGEPVLLAPGGLSRRGQRRYVIYGGCAGVPGVVSTGGISDSAWQVIADSVVNVLREAERRALVPIDSTRVYGETETTCPARPRLPLSAALRHSPNGNEQLLSFVVGRNGGIDSASIRILGDASGADAVAIRRALLGQPWTPGTLSGVRVSQRMHLVLYPDVEPRPSPVIEACAQASTVALRLRVREPMGGVASTDLTQIAHQYSQEIASRRVPGSTTGTFTTVLDERGRPHFFRWVRRPANAKDAGEIEFVFSTALPYLSEGPPYFSSTFSAPMALEIDLMRACP